MDELLRYREPILQTLRELKKEYKVRFKAHAWSEDVFERVFNFSEKGKLLRGALVVFSAQAHGSEIDRDVLQVAAAMELIHSSLLIHDDIMDQDRWRRGEKSIYTVYQEQALHERVRDATHVGLSMGIGVADSVFFLVFEILSGLKSPYKDQLVATMSHELVTVCLGQLDDLWPRSISKESILELYKNKTGRYSFSLPLMAGAQLAGVARADLDSYVDFGLSMGPLFQIADDLLGIYGTQAEIGKPVGSDIREAKQTLYWYLLMEKVSQQEKEQLLSFFGKEVTNDDIVTVTTLIKKYGIDKELDLIKESIKNNALETIKTVHMEPKSREVLQELVAYVTTRRK
jgi:geranylgeranyl diphosphate synthase type I